ncbi:MAG: hypothetical protein ACJ71Z_01895 [Aeromicrobium sp.]
MRPRFVLRRQAARRLGTAFLCVALAGCTRTPPEPHPTGTLEPSITESSPIQASGKPDEACTLLKADERAALPGMSMNAVVPVQPAAGTQECVWVHAPNRPARAAIRIVALSASVWAKQAAPQIDKAIHNPSTRKSVAQDLGKAFAELSRDPSRVPPERICEIFLLLVKAHGMRESDMIGYGTIGAMPAAYANTCSDGVMILAGYGEYGLRPSLALNHGVFRLAEAAHGRAVGLFGAEASATPTGKASATPTGKTSSTPKAEESSSPEPSESPFDY